MRFLLFLILLSYSGTALAKCYYWQLGRGGGKRSVADACTINISLPGVPRKLSDFTVKARGVVMPRIKNVERLDEKKRGKRARNFTVKIVSRAKKIKFCKPQWAGKGRQLVAKMLIDDFDLAEVLVVKGFGRPSEDGKKSWCIN